MALMRYVGPYPEVRVVVAGYEIGNVEHGGSIVVPDELASQVEWSEHWEDGSKTEERKRAREDAKARKEAAKHPVTPEDSVPADPESSIDSNNTKDDE